MLRSVHRLFSIVGYHGLIAIRVLSRPLDNVVAYFSALAVLFDIRLDIAHVLVDDLELEPGQVNRFVQCFGQLRLGGLHEAVLILDFDLYALHLRLPGGNGLDFLFAFRRIDILIDLSHLLKVMLIVVHLLLVALIYLGELGQCLALINIP